MSSYVKLILIVNVFFIFHGCTGCSNESSTENEKITNELDCR